MKVLDTKELLEMEPNLNPNVLKGLYAPTGGIICPFDLVLALAENAYANGVKFKFTQEVVGIEKILIIILLKLWISVIKVRSLLMLRELIVI